MQLNMATSSIRMYVLFTFTKDSVGLYAARLQIPSFTKGKPQLSVLDIETTRSLANVRIHVERVIGAVRQKYTILGHGVVPIQY